MTFFILYLAKLMNGRYSTNLFYNEIENSKSWASFEIESSIIKMNIKSHDTKYDVAVTRKIY